ncbi:MAG: RagB/SusD family nutrient uptake outer membrane protein [Carboxylicivirga sp.]|jgi:hypothetical protein|nr:RagB/SusD family nutrient uptake outer membrane protein [Carboxylicivirga sp.]
MKYSKYIIACVIVGMSLFSCSDDFLTIYPDDAIASDSFFSNEKEIAQGVVGAYAPLRSIVSNDYLFAEMRTDNTQFIYDPSDRGGSSNEEYAEFLDTEHSGQVSHKYNSCYDLIAKANKVIESVPKVGFEDPNVGKNYLAQAHFLRAYAYFHLTSYFGDVPIVTKPVTTYGGAFVQRSAKAEVLSLVLADLEVALNGLPDVSLVPEAELGRATKGAAQMLKAMVYFSQREYKVAEQEFMKVKGYSLIGSYADLWKLENKNNEESIFEVQYQTTDDQAYSNAFFYIFLPKVQNTELITGVDPQVNGGHRGYNTATPDLIACYEEGDERFDATIAYCSTDLVADPTIYKVTEFPYCVKYFAPHQKKDRVGSNWPIWRYAEVLLNIAECRNEQNDPDGAITLINQVRSRAGLGEAPKGNQSHVRKVLDKERRTEFAFENKRWFDLIRTQQAVKVLNDFGAKVKAEPTKYYYHQGYTLIPEAFNVTSERLLFPIPQRERDVNKELTQNPGY